MLAKSLIIFIVVGIIAGFGIGIYTIDYKTNNQLVIVDGSSISIVTEKFDFKQDELIEIKIINSGTNTLTFLNSSCDLKITGLFGILIYSPVYPPVSFTLAPMGEVILSWDQIKNNGQLVSDGVYKISVQGIDSDGNTVEKSTTVSIWK
ncbi:MAG: hypothetical protein M8317_02185 [Nitrosopumilus sp.]|nr:hypothetical protein [Nitrosopumilus sp.]MDC4228478.1 hypothetical protein [Nitrosopumilus sp.]MDC4229931.1 hypothetical protein [Nitrosopumilus sp.]